MPAFTPKPISAHTSRKFLDCANFIAASAVEPVSAQESAKPAIRKAVPKVAAEKYSQPACRTCGFCPWCITSRKDDTVISSHAIRNEMASSHINTSASERVKRLNSPAWRFLRAGVPLMDGEVENSIQQLLQEK